MSNEVVNHYENYSEEDRITTNNARRIEFLTTIRKLDELFKGTMNILDCAAGTGAYAFYLADKGHAVTATDISCFKDESFDVVLNMGPFYHLTDEDARSKCLSESIRVLKKGGLLITAYIPRLYLNQMIAMSDDKYLDKDLLCQIKNTGVLLHDAPKCFWTDAYYSTYDEMQKLYADNGLECVDNFAQDGLAPLFGNTVDKWTYHYEYL